MKDDDFKLLRGFADELTDRQTDISNCRVTFTIEKTIMIFNKMVMRVVEKFEVFW